MMRKGLQAFPALPKGLWHKRDPGSELETIMDSGIFWGAG